MEEILLVIIAVQGLAASASFTPNKNTYFRIPLPQMRRSLMDAADSNGSPWIAYGGEADNAARQGSNQVRKEDSSPPEITHMSPEELRWLWENLSQQEKKNPNFNDDYLDLPKSDTESALSSNSYDADYEDVYDSDKVPDVGADEEVLQQALRDYLSQSPEDLKQRPSPSATEERSTQAIKASSAQDVTSTPSTVTSTTSSSDTATTKAKGQKEFAMLRPASENRRKFDRWAESFQKQMAKAAVEIRATRDAGPTEEQDFLSEQLNNLKLRNARSPLRGSNPVWF